MHSCEDISFKAFFSSLSKMVLTSNSNMYRGNWMGGRQEHAQGKELEAWIFLRIAAVGLPKSPL